MERGYVKVWRKLEDSGLLQMPNTLALFMFLLMKATHRDMKVGTASGIVELKRGQYLSGRLALARAMKQSEREIRTSLDRLTRMEILTIKSTSKYSIYTIEKYGDYQDGDQQTTSTSTNKRPANDQQTTTKQEYKNISTSLRSVDIATLVSHGVPESIARDWLKIRKAKKMELTDTALKATIREAGMAGLTLEQAVTIACERSWAGFRAEYLQGKTKSQKEAKVPFEKVDYMNGVNDDGSF